MNSRRNFGVHPYAKVDTRTGVGMKKYLSGAALTAMFGLDVSPAHGQEVIVDIATFSCTSTAYSYPSSTGGPRSMGVTAKIYLDPSNDATKDAARSCAICQSILSRSYR